MDIKTLEQEIQEKICREVSLITEGLDRYIVMQPFHFDDGDHFVVLLKKDANGWYFTDEAHTLMHMHMQYDDLDLSHGTHASILDSTLTSFSIENRDGELRIGVPDERFGDALFSFLQVLVKISDLDYLTRERARSTFLEDAKALILESVNKERLEFDYHDPSHDPKKSYKVDCRINKVKMPNFVFFIARDHHCRNATIVCHQFEKWGVPFHATGVFEDHQTINRTALAQFSDVAYKQIPNLGSRDRIEEYLNELASSDG